EQLGRVCQPLRMFGAFEDLAAISPLAFEHTARIMQAVREHVQVCALPGHELAVVPDNPLALVERLARGRHIVFSLGTSAGAVYVPNSADFSGFACRSKPDMLITMRACPIDRRNDWSEYSRLSRPILSPKWARL